MGILSDVLDIFFPPKCVFCHKLLKRNEKEICLKCRADMPYTEGNPETKGEFFSKCVSPLYYEGNVRESLLRYKFKGATGYAKVYSKLLSTCIKENLSGSYDLISWAPLSSQHYKERGYDQAMLLALATALELDDVAVSTLEKVVNVEKQSTMGSAEKRRANISGAYRVEDPELIAGKRILLIDDIVTTGSTLAECARTLLTAGASEVVCATVAKARDTK